MVDKELLEQFQIVIQGITDMERRLSAKMKSNVQDAETRINIKIENEVTKRIDSLFDGYKLTHEKQWELERQTEALQAQIDMLQARLAVLENRIA